MNHISLAIFVVKTVILTFGGGIAVIGYKAYRRTGATSLRALAIGFGIVTFGALLAGIAHQLFGVSLQVGVLVNSLLTAIGFGVIMYSLYLEK